MISIKLKLKSKPPIENYLRQFNNVIRFAYNRFCEGFSLGEVYHKAKSINNIELLDSGLIESAAMKAQYIYNDHGKGIVFGGRKEFNKMKQGKKSNFQANRNKWLYSQGRAALKGNKKFAFDFTNNRAFFKPKRGIKFELEFEKPSRNQMRLMNRAQFLADNQELPIGVMLSEDYIVFQIEESVLAEPIKLKHNRILSIDLNPDYVGVVVCDFVSEVDRKIIHKEVVNVSKLATLPTNKRVYEIFGVAKYIATLAKHYQCELVGYEGLSISSGDLGSRAINRKVNMYWNRTRLINTFKKWLNIYGIKHQDIAPQYSSFIGQMHNPNEPDMIAAALEIGRRTYVFNRVYLVKDMPKENFTGVVFPKLEAVNLPTHWKEMVKSKGLKTWRAFFLYVKKTESCYRFLFRDWVKNSNVISLSLKSRKSNVFLCHR